MCDLYGGAVVIAASNGPTSSPAPLCSAPLQAVTLVIYNCKCLNGGKGCLCSSVLQQTKRLLFIIQFESSYLGKDNMRGSIVKPKISRF